MNIREHINVIPTPTPPVPAYVRRQADYVATMPTPAVDRTAPERTTLGPFSLQFENLAQIDFQFVGSWQTVSPELVAMMDRYAFGEFLLERLRHGLDTVIGATVPFDPVPIECYGGRPWIESVTLPRYWSYRYGLCS